MHPLRVLLAALTMALLVCAAAARADDPEWRPILDDLPKKEKADFGGLCGVVVERDTGRVFINVSNRGLYVSDAGAKKFERVSDGQPKGRTETPGCLMLSPDGKKLVSAFVYGSPIGVSTDHGKTWAFMDRASAHVDWCAVDWADPEMKFVLALKHEKGGLLLLSRDGGKSFDEVGKGYGPGWVFDGKTAVVAQAKSKDRKTPNLMRTVDGGKTWKEAGQYSPVGNGSAQALPRWHDGSLHWLTETGLIRTSDRGETWKKVADVKDARYGPVFGKDGKHLFVLTGAGIVES